MALGGDLSKIDLTAIFQTLALNQQVGTLVVTEKDTGRKTSLYFDQNTVALVASDKRNYFRLGQILINRGVISDEVLRRALEQQKRTGGLLGEVLCEMGVTSPDEIEDVVRGQIEEEIFELFQWKNARFEFLEGAPPGKTSLDGYITSINFDPNSLLMEAARRLDEWEVMRDYIPSLQEILIIDEEAWDDDEFEDLSVGERAIIDLLDGERDIQDIAEETSLARFQICKTLYEWLRENKVRTLTPQELEALATDSEQSNNIPLAIKFYLRAFATNDKSEKLSDRLAHCYEMIGESRKAAGYFCHLGDLQWDIGKIAAAVEAYRQAVSLNPLQTVALERLFEHAANENDVDNVLSTGKMLLKSYMKELQVAEAADLCRGLLERFPEDIDLRKQMINIHLDRRDAKAAAKEYEEILEILKKDREWAAMADVCAKIVQLDPDREEYRPLIEAYRARAERSFAKLVRRPIVIVPVLSGIVLTVALLIGYNVLARNAFEAARAENRPGNEMVARERFLEVADSYAFSFVRANALSEAEAIRVKLELRQKRADEVLAAIGKAIEEGRASLEAKDLVRAAFAFEEAIRDADDPQLGVGEQGAAIRKQVEQVRELEAEVGRQVAWYQGQLAAAEKALAARKLDEASQLLDSTADYEVEDELAAARHALRNNLRRVELEGQALELHEQYLSAVEADLSGDGARASELYTACLRYELPNAQRRAAVRYLGNLRQFSELLSERIEDVGRARARRDWQTANGRILSLLREYPDLLEQADLLEQLLIRVNVTGVPGGAKVEVREGGTSVAQVEATEDGVAALDLPLREPGSLTVHVEAEGFDADVMAIDRSVIEEAGVRISARRLAVWQTRLPAGQVTGGGVIDNGVAWVPSRNGNLYGLDLKAGTVLSTYNGDSSRELAAPPTCTGGVIYVGALNGGLVLGIRDEEAVLSQSVGGSFEGAAGAVGDLVVFAGDDRVVRAFAGRGAARWEKPVNGPVEADVLSAPGSVVVGTVTGWVHCFDAAGNERWSREFGQAIRTGMAHDGKNVYVGGARGRLMAYRLADGDPAWPAALNLEPIEIVGGCGVAGDRLIVLGKRGRRGVCSVRDLSDGTIVKNFTLGEQPVGARPLCVQNRFYFGSTLFDGQKIKGGALFAFEVVDGEPEALWQWLSDHAIQGRLDHADGVLVVPTVSGLVFGFRD